MLRKLQEFGRAVRRDYLPARYPDGSGPFSRTLAICLGITWGICLPLVIIFPAVCAWTPILGIGASATIFFDRIREIRRDMKKKTSGEISAADGNTLSLSGPGRDICVIENTQQLIGKMTAGCENAEELPPRLQAKLAPYLRDGAVAAAAINAESDGQPQEHIPFLRRVFNQKGENSVVAASVPTFFGITRKKAADREAFIEEKIGECRDGLSQPLKIRPIRLKRSFLHCWSR